MTIEVIKQGEKPTERAYEAQCYQCKSVIKWQKKDAKRVWDGDNRDGPFTQIDCPVCGGLVTGY